MAAYTPGQTNSSGQVYTCTFQSVQNGSPLAPYTVKASEHAFGAVDNNYTITDPAQINDPNFGIALAYEGSGTVLIESVEVEVYYTTQGGTAETAATNVGNSLTGIAVSSSHRRVAVGLGGKIQYSDDGINWTGASLAIPIDLYAVTWAADRFVATGRYGTILESADGVAWTPIDSGVPNSLYAVHFDPTTKGVYAVGADGVETFRPFDGSWEYRYD